MPMRLDDGWNQIQFNLSDFTRRAYGTNYIETLRVQVGSYICVTIMLFLSDLIYKVVFNLKAVKYDFLKRYDISKL